jgi:adenylate cyclase
MTNDPGHEVFCQGVAEEPVNVLTHQENLKVASRTSSWQHREPHDVRMVGKELGVAVVLEGSVRIVDERVRVTA